MCGCAYIEYNNLSARLRGVVAVSDRSLVLYALSHWAVIAFNIRTTQELYTRISVEDWIDGILTTVIPSPFRNEVIAALKRCRPSAL